MLKLHSKRNKFFCCTFLELLMEYVFAICIINNFCNLIKLFDSAQFQCYYNIPTTNQKTNLQNNCFAYLFSDSFYPVRSFTKLDSFCLKIVKFFANFFPFISDLIFQKKLFQYNKYTNENHLVSKIILVLLVFYIHLL